MFIVLFSLGIIFSLLMLSNYLWRTKQLDAEVSRKFVHVIVGSFIAFWPFLMSFQTIQLLSIAMLVVAIASKRLRLFPGIYSVNRTTWGEILFPVGVWLSAYFTPSPWIFMAAVLHMSLADGFAAIIGVTFGKKHHYQLFGQYKTLLGSLTFWAMSMGITFAVVSQSSVAINDTTLPLLLALPVTATLAENFSPYGTDNVTVPMLVLTFLTYSKLLS